MFGLMTWLAAVGFAYAGEQQKKHSPRVVKRTLDADGYDENGYDADGYHKFAPYSRWMKEHRDDYERVVLSNPHYAMYEDSPSFLYYLLRKEGVKL